MDVNSTDSYGLITDHYGLTTDNYGLTSDDYGFTTDYSRRPHPPPGRGPSKQTMPTDIAITVYSLMVAMGGVGNVAIIIAFAMDHRVRSKPSDLIILALAIADSGICLIMLPLAIANEVVGTWFLGEIGCRLKFFIEPCFVTSGIMLVVILSWDRYLMLAKDYAVYMKIQTQKTVLKLIAIAWLFALLPGILENITWNYILKLILESGRQVPNYDRKCTPPSARNSNYQLMILLLFRLIPITLVIIFGTLFLIHLRRRLLHWKRVGHKVLVSMAGPSVATNATLATESQSVTGHQMPAQHDQPLSQMNSAVDRNTIKNTQSESNHDSKIPNKSSSPDSNEAEDATGHSNRASSVATNINSQEGKPNGGITATKSANKNASILRKRYIKPTITYVALVTALLVCTTPIQIYTMSTLLICPSCFQPLFAKSFHMLVYFNSCLNPLLYALTNKKIRMFYSRKLTAFLRR